MKNLKKKKFNFPFYVFGLRWKSKGLEKKFIWLRKKKKDYRKWYLYKFTFMLILNKKY